MASEEKNYTSEFKKEVAQKALDQSKKNLDGLSDKYDVPVSVILMWATELEKGGPEVFDAPQPEADATAGDHEEFDVVITDQKVAKSVQSGVMDDKLNYKRLVFWSVFGIILVLIFIQSLIEMNQYNIQITQERVSSESEFYKVNQLKSQARDEINSFGVVDLENGIYRIPVDSVINEMAADNN